jgi:hypothetical protein
MPIPESPRPNPWLSLFLPLLVSAATAGASFAVQWGTLGADIRHLEGAHTETRALCLATQAAQGAQAVKAASIETEFTGMRREMERMARALEKLTDEQPRPAHYRR